MQTKYFLQLSDVKAMAAAAEAEAKASAEAKLSTLGLSAEEIAALTK
jgi:hypothetical protein